MSGGRAEGASSSHRSSPIPRGPPTPTSTSPFSDNPRNAQSILANRYILGQELGRGSFGRVYRAFDTEECRFVAIKQISLKGVSKEQLNGVVGEINLLKNLNHENIVQYFDSIKTKNHLYIILEYMESGTLAGVVKQTAHGLFSEKWVAHSVEQVLKGLKYLHGQGVVHRDIKGANILTTKEMVIKLADFGVAAKLAEKGGTGTKEEYYNSIAGSPYWMAPEVIELTGVTTAADIWSIGCVIVELLTGSAPYFDCQAGHALYRIVHDPHPPLPQGITDSLRSFLLNCFIKDPKKRPTAEELLKHDWITANRERSVSPNKMIPKPAHVPHGDTPSTLAFTNDIRRSSIAARILNSTMQSRPPTEHSAAETGTSPDRDNSSMASNRLSRSSSTTMNESPQDATLHDDESPEQFDRRPSTDKIIKKAATPSPVPLPPPIPPQLCQSTRSSFELSNKQDVAAADPSALTKKSNWKDSDHMGYNNTTSTLLTSGASYSDGRSNSPPLSRDECILSVILTDRGYGSDVGGQRGSYDEPTPSHFPIRTSSALPYDPTNVQRVMVSLHAHCPLTSVRPALRDLVNLTRSDAEARSVFVRSDGLLTLVELLLQFDDPEVIEQTLALVLIICGHDVTQLRDSAAVGLASEVFKCAKPCYPLTARLHVAHFIQRMTICSVKTMDAMIQCQGIRCLTSLLVDGERKSMELKEISLNCIDRVLSANSAIEAKVLRMLCMADLPRYLISSMSTIYKTLRPSDPDGITTPEPYVATTVSITKRSSTESLSDHGMPVGRTSSEVSTSTEIYRQTSDVEITPSASTGEPSPSSSTVQPVSLLQEKIVQLLLKICTSESEIHGYMILPEMLHQLLSLLGVLPREMILKVARCLKHLSQRPTVVEHIRDAGIVAELIPLLESGDRSSLTTDIQKEALTIIDNACKGSPPSWIDTAVHHGIVPYLRDLSRLTVEEAISRDDANGVRNIAVPLLCRLLNMSSSEATRKVFSDREVAELFLELLEGDKWHQEILGALASWMDADLRYVEDKIVSEPTIHTLVHILRQCRFKTRNEISDVLTPLLKMLWKSDRLSRTVGTSELPQVILEMLGHDDAGICRDLLTAIRRIYGTHSNPKDFIIRYEVQGHLEHLIESTEERQERILVQKEAVELLKAFDMNQIW